MVKLKEEFDYESLCGKLETQVDHLTAEVERQNKLRNSEKHELEKGLREYENNLAEAEKNAVTRSKVFIFSYYQLLFGLLTVIDIKLSCSFLIGCLFYCYLVLI